jgi:hypothetical protein
MTECNQEVFGFQAQGSRKVAADFSGGHLRGDFTTELPLQPMTFPEPVPDGYKALSDTRHASNRGPAVPVSKGTAPQSLVIPLASQSKIQFDSTTP